MKGTHCTGCTQLAAKGRIEIEGMLRAGEEDFQLEGAAWVKSSCVSEWLTALIASTTGVLTAFFASGHNSGVQSLA